MLNIRRSARDFTTEQAGSVVILFAFTAMLSLVVIGGAIDFGRTYIVRTQLQAATDAAALTVATVNADSEVDRRAAGQNSFLANLDAALTHASANIAIGKEDITVTGTAQVGTTFLELAGFKSFDVSTLSKVGLARVAGVCILALQPSRDGIFLSGDSAINANCGLQANSSSSNALDANGDSRIDATLICVVGGFEKDSKTILNPTPQKGCPPIADPLASLPVPFEATTNCTASKKKVDSGKSATLSPGVYCEGIDIGSSAKVFFKPGLYVIRDGEFKIGSSAQVTGQEVMFYLTGKDARFDMGSQSNINFTAPLSGTYKGVVIFQSRAANTAENKFGSSSDSVLQGAVYIPNGTVLINCDGSVGASADYTVWVVKRLELGSHARLHVTSKYDKSGTPLANGLDAMVYRTVPFLIR